MRSIQLVHRKKICTKLFGIYNVAQSWVGNEELLCMRSIQLVHRKKICTKLFGIYNVVQSWVGNEARNQNFVY